MQQNQNGKHVVVLGAAGFVGRHVCHELASRGFIVIGIGHGNWLADEWQRWGLHRWIESDINLQSLQQLKLEEPIACVLHCAGSGAVSYSYAAPWEDFQRAAVTTVAALEWMRNQPDPRPRLVLVSSAAVYGDNGDSDAQENSTRSPISPYGFHKLSAEMLCESYSRFFEVPVSIVRLFSVYGEGLRKQLLWDALNKFRSGSRQFFGTGEEVRDWIHVEDAAELLAVAGLTQQSAFEIYNGGGEHATTREVLTRLAMAYGHDEPVVFNGEIHKGNPRRLTADCQHTMRLIQWKPRVRLEDGIVRYASWFQTQSSEETQYR